MIVIVINDVITHDILVNELFNIFFKLPTRIRHIKTAKSNAYIGNILALLIFEPAKLKYNDIMIIRPCANP